MGKLEDLHTHLESGLPPIVYVDTGELRSYWAESTNHAVVVIGIEDDRVYLNDPDFETAPQTVSIAEFILAWLEQDYLYAVIGLAPIEKVNITDD
jgi:predicted double-glycine peptidase